MDIAKVMVIAILIEAIVENLKMVCADKKLNVTFIVSMVVSIVICLAVNFDIFKLVDITINIKYLGAILTGIIVARGSNFTHSLLNTIENIKNGTKV